MSTVRYNPHAPKVIGPEYFGTRDRPSPVSWSVGRAALCQTNTVEDVDEIDLFMRTRSGRVTDAATARYGVDIYDSTLLDSGAATVLHTLPAGPAPIADSIGFHPVPSTLALWQTVAQFSPDLPPAAGNYARFQYDTTSPEAGYGTMRFQLDPNWRNAANAVVDPHALRILDLRLDFNCQVQNPAPMAVIGVVSFDGQTEYQMGGLHDSFAGSAISIPGDNQVRRRQVSIWGRALHRMSQSLRPTDLDALAVGGPGWIGLRWMWAANRSYAGFGPAGARTYNLVVNLQVCTERRLATGWATGNVADDPNDAGAWVPFMLESPFDGSPRTLTKSAGRTWLIVARQTNTTGQRPGTNGNNDWRGIDAGVTAAHQNDVLPGFGAMDLSWTGTPEWYSSAVPIKVAVARAGTRMPAWVWKSGGTVVGDSQAYVRPLSVYVFGGDPSAIVGLPPNAAQATQLEQDFSNADPGNPLDDYGIISVAVHNIATMFDVVEPLIMRIRQRSDDAILGTALFDPQDFRNAIPKDKLGNPRYGDGLWYILTKRADSGAVMQAGDQLYLEAESATSSSFPWELAVMDSGDEPGADATFGGTVDTAHVVTPGVSTPEPAWDALMNLRTVPEAPQSLTCRVMVQNVSHGLDGGCVLPTADYVLLEWELDDYTNFGWWELQRTVDGGVTWEPFASIGDKNSRTIADVEMPRNIPVSYRVRVIRLDSTFSDWTECDEPMTPTLAPWGIVLATNAAPELMVSYLDEASYDWQPVDGTRGSMRYLYGRDMGVMLRETEHRGDVWKRKLIIAFDSPREADNPLIGGRRVFDPLLAVAHFRTAPYIVFADHRGYRAFTAPMVTDCYEDEPFGQYRSDVSFTEVSGPIEIRTFFTPDGSFPSPLESGWDIDRWDEGMWR